MAQQRGLSEALSAAVRSRELLGSFLDLVGGEGCTGKADEVQGQQAGAQAVVLLVGALVEGGALPEEAVEQVVSHRGFWRVVGGMAQAGQAGQGPGCAVEGVARALVEDWLPQHETLQLRQGQGGRGGRRRRQKVQNQLGVVGSVQEEGRREDEGHEMGGQGSERVLKEGTWPAAEGGTSAAASTTQCTAPATSATGGMASLTLATGDAACVANATGVSASASSAEDGAAALLFHQEPAEETTNTSSPGISTAPGPPAAPGTSTAPGPSNAPGTSTARGTNTAPCPPYTSASPGASTAGTSQSQMPAATTITSAPPEVERQCAQCGQREGELHWCSGCMAVKYCGVQCQSVHWREHKEQCRRVKREQKKAEAAANDAALRQAEADINSLTQDQTRIRSNIESLNRVNGQQDQVQQYARQLAAAETKLAALRDTQSDLRKKKTALDGQLNSLMERIEF